MRGGGPAAVATLLWRPERAGAKGTDAPPADSARPHPEAAHYLLSPNGCRIPRTSRPTVRRCFGACQGLTTRGQHVSCDVDTSRVAFCGTENIGTPNLSYAAQYLACALPCERFASALAGTRASLGAGVARYAFTVTDFHRLPPAGLPAHPSTSSKAPDPARPLPGKNGPRVMPPRCQRHLVKRGVSSVGCYGLQSRFLCNPFPRCTTL
jgi:hypothetical protein